MPDLAIRAERLSKTYRLHRERSRTLKEVVLRQYAPAERIDALVDVSFEVAPGEAFGVIGANGSGKSTLLKLVAGTAKPTSGALEVNGRVSALLEIGAGFHPDFRARKKTIVLVSHDLGAVGRLCERAIWLDRGRVAASGSVRDVITKYHFEV